MSGHHAVLTVERRDASSRGVSRRKRFDDSIALLRTLGLSSGAVDYYRRAARKTRKLPHELVCDIAESAAEHAGVLALMGIDQGHPA